MSFQLVAANALSGAPKKDAGAKITGKDDTLCNDTETDLPFRFSYSPLR
jgi:hypothetical protein